MHLPDIEGCIESFDGTSIAWQSFGQGPAILVANGLGVSWKGMSLQIEHLMHDYQVICWDYRGSYASDKPRSSDLGVHVHARDAHEVLKKLGIEQAHIIGWSMGVQVAIEMLRVAPNLPTRFALMGGVPYSPFKATSVVPLAHRLLRRLTGASAPFAPLASPLIRRALRSPSFFPLAKKFRYIRPDINREVFLQMARGVSRQDFGLYLRTLAALGRHDGSVPFEQTAVPILFIAGEKDGMIRPRVVKKVVQKAKNIQVEILPDCSHFALLEEPDLVNKLLEEFFLRAQPV